jgi:hypothetical protein
LYVDRVTEREIVLAISKLKNNETCGPDQIPSFLIRDCRHLLAPPLKVIFNSIIKCSAFPVKCKESRITPVYKNGDRCEITNYRPIAIINNFSKIFELVLFNRIYNHVAHMTSFFQHGFQARRSTVTNLLSVTHFLQVNLDARKQIDVIYMDFSKAFDRVDHKLLLTKLDSFGFSDNLIQLIASYLSDRALFVQYRGFSSGLFQQLSGVPQGSVLGPLFFVIFSNDMTDLLDVPFQLDADDLKIYNVIETNEDCLKLQRNIDLIQN